jgi:hypothetical protein
MSTLLDLWPPPRSHCDPGVEGNRRLTALVGAVQFVLLPLAFLSGLVFGSWPALHYFLGFAAIPPTLLKLGSTGWRFLNYYGVRRGRYRAAGPPFPLPRLLAPLVVVSAVLAFATGVVLFFQGSERGTTATLHTDSVVVLTLVLLLHVGVHLRTAWEASAADLRPGPLRALRGTITRRALVVGATVAGVVVAVALVVGYHWTLVRRVGEGLRPR